MKILKPRIGGKPGEMVVIACGANVGKSHFLEKLTRKLNVNNNRRRNNMNNVIKVTKDNIKSVLTKGDKILINGQKREIDYCYWHEGKNHDIGIELTEEIEKFYRREGFMSTTISCVEIRDNIFEIFKVPEENECPVEFETGMVVVEKKQDGQILTGIVFKSENEKDNDIIKYIYGDSGFDFLYYIENENLEKESLITKRTVMKVYKPSSNRFIPTNIEDFEKLRDDGFLDLIWDRKKNLELAKTVKSGDRLVDDLDGENIIISFDKGLLTLTSLHTGKKYIDNIAVYTNKPTMETVRKVLRNSGFDVMSKIVSLKQ